MELATQLKSVPTEMVLPLEVALTAMVFAVSVSIKFKDLLGAIHRGYPKFGWVGRFAKIGYNRI